MHVVQALWCAFTQMIKDFGSINRAGNMAFCIINIITDIGDQAYAMDCEIDWDMGGRGFVRAMNVDDDPELEIVCYSMALKANRYLDASSGSVIERPFAQASAEAQQLAKRWLDAHYPNTLALGVLLMLTLLYYSVVILALLLAFLYRRFLKKPGQNSP